ncbi:MAG: glutaredoxin family protein [Syntrophales bacterium]|jgi:glutaredoxin
MQQRIKTNNPGRKGGKIATFILILAALTIYLCTTAVAEMYKWVDDKGEMHITDSPPPAAKSPGEIKVYKDSQEDSLDTPPASVRKKEESRPSFERKKNADVVLYTTSWCPYCRKARDYLRSRGIDFIEYDIEKDKEAAIRKKQLDNRGGVPFAIINGRSISGFSASAYERALTQ